MAEGPVQFIWVQLFLWSLLVSPALIKVSAALPAPIDGPLAAEEGAAATPSPGPGLGAVGALITIPRSCRVLQRDPPRASTQGHVAKPGKAFRAPPRAAASPPSAGQSPEPGRAKAGTWALGSCGLLRAASQHGLEMPPAPWKVQGSSCSRRSVHGLGTELFAVVWCGQLWQFSGREG